MVELLLDLELIVALRLSMPDLIVILYFLHRVLTNTSSSNYVGDIVHFGINKETRASLKDAISVKVNLDLDSMTIRSYGAVDSNNEQRLIKRIVVPIEYSGQPIEFFVNPDFLSATEPISGEVCVWHKLPDKIGNPTQVGSIRIDNDDRALLILCHYKPEKHTYVDE